MTNIWQSRLTHPYSPTEYARWHAQHCENPECAGHLADPYGAQKALAEQVARDLAGMIARLPTTPLPPHGWREPSPEALAMAAEAERRGLDPRIGLIAAQPNAILASLTFRAIQCHDYPTDFSLPTTDPDE